MKAVHVELSPKKPPSRWMWAVVGALAVGVCAVLALNIHTQRQLHDLQAELAVAQRAKEEGVISATPPRQAAVPLPPPPYAADAWSALKQRQFPLERALTALETVTVAGVMPTSLDINTTEGTVRVQVEFSDYAALLQYLAELNGGEAVERWRLVNAQGSGVSGGASSSATVASTWTRAGP